MSEHRLNKIVVERPRGGARLKTPPGAKRIQQKEGDEGRTRVSLKRCWEESGHSKSFSDNLNPLYRWLRSQVGQPWDKVYSQLSHRLDRRSLSGQHIFVHVWEFVERYVVIINGVPYARDNLKYPLGGWRRQLYVHPQTGILCIAEKPSRKRHFKKRNDSIVIDKYHQYHKIDDIWYLVTFREVPVEQKVFDIILQEQLTYGTAQTHYDRPIYASHKRHCTKKEIKTIEKQIDKI